MCSSDLLFVGLCRAAGIPVRPCSGYVCIGGDWGGHSWCEVWVGRWIGADPTTNEIGTRARYILLVRPEETGGVAGRITPERMTILIRRAEYGDGVLEIGDGVERDPVVFSGIRLGPVPEGWEVTRGESGVLIMGPGFTVTAALVPDHGYRAMPLLLRRLRRAKEGAFGGRPAAVSRLSSAWLVSLGREILKIDVEMLSGASGPPEDALAKLFAPTLERAD